MIDLPPGLDPNLGILAPGLRAPLPLVANPRHVLQRAFRSILSGTSALRELIDPAASTGGGMVHACQELVLGAGRLAAAPREGLAEAIRTVLWACRDLQGACDAAYVLRQVAETIAGAADRKPAAFERSKDLMGPLDRHLEELGLPERMDPARFGVLQVQLDEAYDVASLQLQRFYGALQDAEPFPAFAAFARTLAATVAKELVPDQVLGIGAGAGRERTGLMDLLPELETELS
jgi:hypothetical protein